MYCVACETALPMIPIQFNAQALDLPFSLLSDENNSKDEILLEEQSLRKKQVSVELLTVEFQSTVDIFTEKICMSQQKIDVSFYFRIADDNIICLVNTDANDGGDSD